MFNANHTKRILVLGAALALVLASCGDDDDDHGKEGRQVSSSLCQGPSPAGCSEQNPCDAGYECKDVPGTCVSSGCSCMDTGNGYAWTCTPDCTGKSCVPIEKTPPTCTGPNPGGCGADNPCPADHTCEDVPGTCISSGCSCMDTGNGYAWTCTPDCMGKSCVPKKTPPTCTDPNPAGCTPQNACPPNSVCKVLPGTCLPSACACTDTASGPTWSCTPDCMGGTCVLVP